MQQSGFGLAVCACNEEASKFPMIKHKQQVYVVAKPGQPFQIRVHKATMTYRENIRVAVRVDGKDIGYTIVAQDWYQYLNGFASADADVRYSFKFADAPISKQERKENPDVGKIEAFFHKSSPPQFEVCPYYCNVNVQDDVYKKQFQSQNPIETTSKKFWKSASLRVAPGTAIPTSLNVVKTCVHTSSGLIYPPVAVLTINYEKADYLQLRGILNPTKNPDHACFFPKHSPEDVKPDKKPWNCSQCNLQNFEDNCQSCSQLRPKVRIKSEDSTKKRKSDVVSCDLTEEEDSEVWRINKKTKLDTSTNIE